MDQPKFTVSNQKEESILVLTEFSIMPFHMKIVHMKHMYQASFSHKNEKS